MYLDPQAVSGSAFVSASEICGMCRFCSYHPHPYRHISQAIFDCCHSATLLGVYFLVAHLFSVRFLFLGVPFCHDHSPSLSRLFIQCFLVPLTNHPLRHLDLANIYATDLKHHRCNRIGTWASRCGYPPPPSPFTLCRGPFISFPALHSPFSPL